MFKKALYSLHQILGTVLSILFLVWFLSGFVMIYRTFPKATERDKNSHSDVLQGGMPSVDSAFSNIPKDKTITRLSLKSFSEHPYFEVKTSDSTYRVSTDSALQQVSNPTFVQIQRYAEQWCDAEIVKVDSLRELDQWIPFGKLRKEFPIYKFYFEDNAKHQLYVSSVSGEALQFTDRNSRMWAWLGAIPHWVYFTWLRQNAPLWVDVVVWLSGIGCIMCITGIVLGVRSYVIQYRKKKKLKTPYVKFVYKWHHILGFAFGIFVFTFVFSGMMSLASIPSWMVKVNDTTIKEKVYKTDDIDLKSYQLDYRELINKYSDQIKMIEWTSFGKLPLYKIVVDKHSITIDASQDTLKVLKLSEEDVLNRLASIHDEPMRITLMDAYDNYYVGLTDHLPLPVYKVEVDDPDKSTYYINPKNGNVRYFNSNAKVLKWTYQGLHSFKFKFLAERPVLWNIVMWVTMIGGTLVSLTGVWLAIKYVRRKIKRLKNKYICSK